MSKIKYSTFHTLYFLVGVLSLNFVQVFTAVNATENSTDDLISKLSANIQPDVVTWRRHIHKHPELGNREFKTAAYVSQHLRSLGFDEVTTGVAHTGVVGLLKGDKPGPIVALRADMDALPVEEQTNLPFSSINEGVMHACGHDAHTAILMGVASVLSEMRQHINGSVMFIFQPAEEGPPPGEEGGAKLMIEEGIFEKYPADAIFGLHVMPFEHGMIGYRKKGTMASSSGFKIDVLGKQTHGAMPWAGQDPISAGAQIVTALQLIPSRQLDITQGQSLISVGQINAGVRANIIPDTLVMQGIIRMLDPEQTQQMYDKVKLTARNIAASAGLDSKVEITPYYPVTYNSPDLVDTMLPSLKKHHVTDQVVEVPPILGSEDFSFYQKDIPGFFFFLGVNAPDIPKGQAAPNHSPFFDISEDTMETGVNALSTLTIDYLAQHKLNNVEQN